MNSFWKLNGTASALAVIAVLHAGPASTQSCNADTNGQLPDGCLIEGAGELNPAPVLPNTEPETGPISNNAGFVLSLDGETVDGDPQIEERIRVADVAIAEADVQIQLDTLDPDPRLDVEIAGQPRGYRTGETVTLISESNYPAFIERAEMRVIDRGAPGGPRLLASYPVTVGGQANIVMPEGRDVAVVHRVYDARGRYDETQALSLTQPDDRGQLDTVEEGNDFTATRNIRVTGGTVTVSAGNVAQGSVLRTMGTRVIPDRNGNLVVQRILPRGDYAVNVAIDGPTQDINLSRPIEVPGGDWFYVAVADVTLARMTDGASGVTSTETTGRLQYFVEGETDSGVRIVSSLDTGDGPLEEVFQRLDEKNPRDLIERMDPNDGYTTYGDDSTSEDLTPTSGRFYLRVEQDQSFLLWGDYQATLTGNGYLRNERTLYGLQGHYETPATTERGDSRATVDLYAAQPDQLIGRDVFRGTGGSVYFLSEQDISPGTQTLTVELRDSATGRVIDRITLIEGRDYQINSLQGVITLSQPLSDTIDRRLISTQLGGDETISLVAQYEYTPTTSDVDGMSLGGRVESWVTDDVRVGVTAMEDETGVSTQSSAGLDLRYQIGDNSFVQLDYATSDGPGYTRALSSDGGLVFGTEAGVDDSGAALKLEAQVDLADMGMARSGVIAAYFEDREQGFSSLDYSVTAATGDETLYGVSAIVEKSDTQLGYTVYADIYENGVGEERLEIGGAIDGNATARLGYELGAEYLEEVTGGVSATRTDVALRLTYAMTSDVDVYVFGQATIDNTGLEDNDRFGVGLAGDLGGGWNVNAELSDGTGGLGARLLATQTRDDNSSTYFGYELDARRALDAGVSSQDNGGRYVIGGTRHINDQTTVFGENTYDIFGDTRELIGAYGVTYTPSDFLSYTVSLNLGQLEDDTNGDIDRQAISAAVRYEDEDLRAFGRVEYRLDEFETAGEPDADAFFLAGGADYRLSDSARLLFNADYANTEANGVSFQEGELVDVSLGYAYRPVENERLNVLGRYRYFLDDVGQEIDGVATNGPVQESHIVSIEGNYDLTQQWTIGGKFGGRWAETAATAGDPLSSNDAALAVLNARFHALHEWDILLEARYLTLLDAQTDQTSALGAIYRQVGENAQIGVGYNFGSFSDDLTDLTFDDKGVFLNIVASY